MNCKSVECQTENEQQSGERERERERERPWSWECGRMESETAWGSGLDSSPSNVGKIFLGV